LGLNFVKGAGYGTARVISLYRPNLLAFPE
jgi:hypothetical protein